MQLHARLIRNSFMSDLSEVSTSEEEKAIPKGASNIKDIHEITSSIILSLMGVKA